MKIIFVLFTILITSCVSITKNLNRDIASPKEGVIIANGGNVLICDSNVDILDYALKSNIKYSDSKDDETIIKIIEKLKIVAGITGLEFESFYNQFINRYENKLSNYYKWSERTFDLNKLNDSEIDNIGYIIPKNCEVKQIVRRHSTKNIRDGIEFLANENFLKTIMQKNQLSWLLVHEFLWTKFSSSVKIREFNEFLHSNEFLSLESDNINNRITKYFEENNLMNKTRIIAIDEKFVLGDKNKILAISDVELKYLYLGSQKVLIKQNYLTNTVEIYNDIGEHIYKIKNQKLYVNHVENSNCGLLYEIANGQAVFSYYQFSDNKDEKFSLMTSYAKYLFSDIYCYNNVLLRYSGTDYDYEKQYKVINDGTKSLNTENNYRYMFHTFDEKKFLTLQDVNGYEYILDVNKNVFVKSIGQIKSKNETIYNLISFPSFVDKIFICNSSKIECSYYNKTEFKENYSSVENTDLIKVDFVKIMPEDGISKMSGNAYIYTTITDKGKLRTCRIASRIYDPFHVNSLYAYGKYSENKFYYSVSKLDKPLKCFFDHNKHYICTFDSERKFNNRKTDFVYDFTDCNDFHENKLDVKVIESELPN